MRGLSFSRSAPPWQGRDTLPGWGAVLLFFAPDLGFLGYLLVPKVGAIVYNALHIYGFGALFITFGLILPAPRLPALGALWLAHAGADRMLGYGLKSAEGVEITHLGPIGKSRRGPRGLDQNPSFSSRQATLRWSAGGRMSRSISRRATCRSRRSTVSGRGRNSVVWDLRVLSQVAV